MVGFNFFKNNSQSQWFVNGAGAYGAFSANVSHHSGMATCNTTGKINSYTYELSDHLGNVRATLGKSVADNTTQLLTATDYYPFGMTMPGRNYRLENYRFGYQGQFAEKDEETGYNQFEARLYDARIGRWMCPDPLRFGFSPYIGMANNPIYYTDPDGRWPWSQNVRQAKLLASETGGTYHSWWSGLKQYASVDYGDDVNGGVISTVFAPSNNKYGRMYTLFEAGISDEKVQNATHTFGQKLNNWSSNHMDGWTNGYKVPKALQIVVGINPIIGATNGTSVIYNAISDKSWYGDNLYGEKQHAVAGATQVITPFVPGKTLLQIPRDVIINETVDYVTKP